MSTATAVTDDANELSCVLIPTPGTQLLLPNVCIAEIVPWRRIKALKSGPDWCMGHVGWRGKNLPVVHYAGFDEQDMDQRHTARCLVVMNRARHSSGPAFYALASQGLPRMLQLAAEDIRNLDQPLGTADAMRVEVGTEAAVIPNLAYIEDRLAELQKSLRETGAA